MLLQQYPNRSVISSTFPYPPPFSTTLQSHKHTNSTNPTICKGNLLRKLLHALSSSGTLLDMAERQQLEVHHSIDSPSRPPPSSNGDMMSCVMALEAALLPCLPARELQAIDRSSHPSHPIDVERHARDFMEAAKKLQLYFIGLQREEQPTRVEMLRKEIAMMEEELQTKTELINKQERLIEGWRAELKDQLENHNSELEKV